MYKCGGLYISIVVYTYFQFFVYSWTWFWNISFNMSILRFQGVLRALIKNSRTLRLPAHLHERLISIRQAKVKLEDQGITPSIMVSWLLSLFGWLCGYPGMLTLATMLCFGAYFHLIANDDLLYHFSCCMIIVVVSFHCDLNLISKNWNELLGFIFGSSCGYVFYSSSTAFSPSLTLGIYNK